MIIGVLKESAKENRVAFTPELIPTLLGLNVKEILIESGAGSRAFFSDEQYTAAGAVISKREDVIKKCDMLFVVNPPDQSLLEKLNPKTILIGNLQALYDLEFVQKIADRRITSFSLDLVPRTTRAQSMDILSSMATAAGYKAVIMAAAQIPKFFPMFMTAAGTIKPAKVLILGAGVAGLQAIATARRLGAVVEAFDVRTAAKEEVLSLGAKFVEVEGAVDDASAGGYAVEQSEEYKNKQAELVQQHAAQSDIVICTAQIPGRKAPVLVTQATVEVMKPGSVIVDLAASTGGNCALTQNDKTILHKNVYIIGDSNLASTIPSDGSNMYGKNMINFLKIMLDKEGNINLNFEDDLIAGSCLTHEGAISNERVKGIIAKAKSST